MRGEGASAAHPSALQAADAGRGSAREGEASGVRVRGDYFDPRFAMFQAFSNGLIGSVHLRGEMERRMAEAMTGDFRDEGLGTGDGEGVVTSLPLYSWGNCFPQDFERFDGGARLYSFWGRLA